MTVGVTEVDPEPPVPVIDLAVLRRPGLAAVGGRGDRLGSAGPSAFSRRCELAATTP